MSQPAPARGLFVSVEGIDGSGKSTQVRALADRLRAQGRSVILTREPGGAEGAEAIRALLVEGAPDRWSPVTELLLFNAARRDHLERTITPALDRGDVVICDRFADSTRVYQGLADPRLRRLADTLHAQVIGREPDITVIIDMDPADAAARCRARGASADRFEARGADFQTALRNGFLALANEYPDRCTVIDGNHPATEVTDALLARIAPRLACG